MNWFDSEGKLSPSKMAQLAKTRSIKKLFVSLPLSRIRTIMKSSPDVDCVSQDAVFLITKCTELFISHLTQAAYRQAYTNRILDYKALSTYVQSKYQLSFLHEILPHKVTYASCLEYIASCSNAGQPMTSAQADAQAKAQAKAEAEARAHAEARAQAQAHARARAKVRAQKRAENRVEAHAQAIAHAEALTKARAIALAQARDEAQAPGRAQVITHGRDHAQAQARAHGQSQARTHGQSQARAHGQSQARAQGQAQARAQGQAQARAQGQTQAREQYLHQNPPKSLKKKSSSKQSLKPSKKAKTGSSQRPKSPVNGNKKPLPEPKRSPVTDGMMRKLMNEKIHKSCIIESGASPIKSDPCSSPPGMLYAHNIKIRSPPLDLASTSRLLFPDGNNYPASPAEEYASSSSYSYSSDEDGEVPGSEGSASC